MTQNYDIKNLKRERNHLARSSAFSMGVIILSTVRKAAKFAV